MRREKQPAVDDERGLIFIAAVPYGTVVKTFLLLAFKQKAHFYVSIDRT
jgi:hypothetical protein